ncbi:MAG: polysaccharide deacetylase family protein [Verrucomicrobiota bacterium]
MPAPAHPLLTRRTLLARSAGALAALSLARFQTAVAVAAADSGTNVATAKRKIAVTIDDGPATGAARDLEVFLRIADGLREAFVAEKVPAIMFVNERQFQVDGQRDARVAALQRWLEAGLDLGNHTYSHPNLNDTPLPRYLDDIVKGEAISRSLLEARRKKLVWFRYPFLATGNAETARAVEDFLAQRGYRIAPVSVDYHDYTHAGIYSRHLRAGDKEKAGEQFATMLQALEAAFARAEKRSIEILGYELPQTLLIHCNEMNALTLRTTLQRIRDRGYTFVSLDEAMADPAYNIPGVRPGGMGGAGLLNSLAAAKRGAEVTK